MLCFSIICVPAGSKSNLSKAAGTEVAIKRRHEKLHAAGCSEKHILKSKCKKINGLGPLFKVTMWKNCIALS